MGQSLTPMMQQYMLLKEKYSDCLLFFRLGDFYELFFDDAKTASKELELMLTGRDCGLSERAPMCGVPYHSVDVYINKLITKGYKVAICEQMEDPALAKGLVERDVIRIITPGTVIEEKMLEEGRNNYIVSAFLNGDVIGIAYADVSTGEFSAFELRGERTANDLFDELTRIAPTELIANATLKAQSPIWSRLSKHYYCEICPDVYFTFASAGKRIKEHFHVNSLHGFGCESLPTLTGAAGALLQYLEETQKNALSHIGRFRIENRSRYMALDTATRRNLELTQPLQTNGNKKNTLLYLLNHTQTAMGSRLMRSWIDRPLQSVEEINERLDAVEALSTHSAERLSLAAALNGIHDIERLCSKIVYGTVNARDCIAIGASLSAIPEIRSLLSSLPDACLSGISEVLDDMADVRSLLQAAIADEPPLSVKDGDIIREGYHREIDELRQIKKGSGQWLNDFENGLRQRTGIKNLKVGYNRVFGYYIEVTRSYLNLVPEEFVRKQTLANAERFITPELKTMEEKILTASDKLKDLEYSVFLDIRQILLESIERLQQNATLLAEADALYSLADVAVTNRYCKPQINENGIIRMLNGRHPIVERALKGEFIPNDVTLSPTDDRLLIITGPNMAGKSTYMRQVALSVLMAHIGSFVPADEAEICLVDRIFTRIGASDDLSSGQSTFMVEMNEVANILNNATKNSLLILDEIGRGTSTFDGLSIAWAVLEHIASPDCGAKALFATHYHELTELEGQLDGVKNYRVAVREMGEDILFLRKIVRGSADKSFGIQVARLAGIPDTVLHRAKDILAELEAADINKEKPQSRSDTSGYGAGEKVQKDPSVERIMKTLKTIDIDHLTLVEALNQLYHLCTIARSGDVS